MEKGAAVLRALARTPSYFETAQMPGAGPDEAPPTSAAAPAPAAAAVPTAQEPVSTAWDLWVRKWEVPRKILHMSIGFLVMALYVNHVQLDGILRSLTTAFILIGSTDLLRLNARRFEQIYEKVLGFLMREGERERVNGVIWYLAGVIVTLHIFPEDIACVSVMMLSWCDPTASTVGRMYGRYTPALPSPPFARRKSLIGFIGATLSGCLTAYIFWGTSVAERGERASGLSWTPHGLSYFGTPQAPGPAHTGWMGFRDGFQSHGTADLGNFFANLFSGEPRAMPPCLLYISAGLIAGVAEGLDLGGIDDNISVPILCGLGLWGVLYAWGRWVVVYPSS